MLLHLIKHLAHVTPPLYQLIFLPFVAFHTKDSVVLLAWIFQVLDLNPESLWVVPSTQKNNCNVGGLCTAHLVLKVLHQPWKPFKTSPIDPALP